MAEANELLADQGIGGRFTDRLLAAALSRHTPQRIRHAIARSPNDGSAHRFVVNLLIDADGAADPHGGEDTESHAHGRAFAQSPPATARSGAVTAEDLDAVPMRSHGGGRPHGGRSADGSRDDGAPGDRPLPLTYKAYGKRAAVEFREHVATQGYDTVMIEAAGSLGPRRYDWKHKISVQIMPRELPAVAAVLCGAVTECEFRHHGPAKNKGFAIQRQGRQFYVKVFRSGDDHAMHGVPVPAEEAFFFSALVLRQLSRLVPEAGPEIVTAALRAYASVARRAVHNG